MAIPATKLNVRQSVFVAKLPETYIMSAKCDNITIIQH